MSTKGAAPRGGVLPPSSPAPAISLSGAAGVLPLYTATIFLSALLVFAIQPMFTKMVLPLLGGSPGVWNTAMLFFQTVLLAGYAYAHLTTRLLSPSKQMLLHMAVLALAFVALPIGIATGWTPPVERAPVPWLIGLFAMSVGLPFFAVSANAPLLQRWFARSGHKAAADPYFLYGASNIGSILALLGYPVIMEPLLNLEEQSQAWTIGYTLLAVLIAVCGWSLRRGAATHSEPRPAAEVQSRDRIDWRRRMHWVVLAFAPSSLLLGVTAHISTDIAAAPFLWVIPLTLYLLTFVFVFSRRPLLKHAWMVRAQPYFVIFVAIVFWWGAAVWVTFPIHLLAFFVTAMVCHGELARRRPAAAQLTEFYLWMSFGGMLGGAFNALLAPVVFDSVIEYPIALVLACMLRPMLGAGGSRQRLWADLALPALLLVAIAIPVMLLDVEIADLGLAGIILVHVGLGLFAFSFRLRPLRFGFGIGAVIFAMAMASDSLNVIDRERSFFGVYKVKIAQTGRHRLLVSGTTVHGAQNIDDATRREPLTYFNREGPIGQVFAALEGARPLGRVGVVGLGAGSLACYRHPAESWTFYEIDPVVERLARDERYFNFLADCAPDAEIVLGDARLSLDRVVDGYYDLLILDAFSSDAIPVHLLTRQAIALYRQKLAAGGVLVFHVSNRNLELVPVLANLAADAGLVGMAQYYRPEGEAAARTAYKIPSKWVVMARSAEDLAFLDGDTRWSPLAPDPGTALWTDDFSNILGVFIW